MEPSVAPDTASTETNFLRASSSGALEAPPASILTEAPVAPTAEGSEDGNSSLGGTVEPDGLSDHGREEPLVTDSLAREAFERMPTPDETKPTEKSFADTTATAATELAPDEETLAGSATTSTVDATPLPGLPASRDEIPKKTNKAKRRSTGGNQRCSTSNDASDNSNFAPKAPARSSTVGSNSSTLTFLERLGGALLLAPSSKAQSTKPASEPKSPKKTEGGSWRRPSKNASAKHSTKTPPKKKSASGVDRDD